MNSALYRKHGNSFLNTAQKMKFYIKDFFSKCDQIRSFLRICSHLLKKSLMENFIFCAVKVITTASQKIALRLKSNIKALDWNVECVQSFQPFFQIRQWKHQNIVRNLFKGNNKDNRTTSMASFWCPHC